MTSVNFHCFSSSSVLYSSHHYTAMMAVAAATSTGTDISQTSAWSSMTEQIVSSVLRTPITVIALSSAPSVVDPSIPTNVCAYSHILSHALFIGFCLHHGINVDPPKLPKCNSTMHGEMGQVNYSKLSANKLQRCYRILLKHR